MTALAVGVLSKGRPNATWELPPLLVGLDPTWFVPEGEGADYLYAAGLAGHEVNVVELPDPGPGLSPLAAHRNAVLDWADDRVCVQFDDDLTPYRRSDTGITFTEDGESERPIGALEAVELIRQGMLATGAKLGGAATTTNRFFYSPARRIGTAHFIIASFMVAAPTDLRFDLRLTSKEDYDYTLQHLHRYGVVARADGIMPNFKHYTNPGGTWGDRSNESDEAMVALLMEKWPDDVKVNTRRGPHELLMRWKGGRDA